MTKLRVQKILEYTIKTTVIEHDNIKKSTIKYNIILLLQPAVHFRGISVDGARK